MVVITKRDYWNKKGDHRPYRNMVHDSADKLVVGANIVHELLDPFSDGDIIEITAVKTGQHPGHFQRNEAHTYVKVPEITDIDAAGQV